MVNDSNKTFEKRFSERKSFWVLYALLIIVMHAYLFMALKEALGLSFFTITWVPFSIFMTALSFITRRTERIRSDRQRKWTDRAGVLWLAFVFTAAMLSLFIHFGEALFTQNITNGKVKTISVMLFAFLTILYGVRRANRVETIKIKILTKKMERERLRIVQLTDMHIGPWTGPMLLQQVIDKINAAKPDIVVVTGDLVDGHGAKHEEDAKKLRTIKAPLGVFAVTGNHDYYDDVDDSIRFMKKSGMKVLYTEVAEAGGIMIAGADDRDHLIHKAWGLSRSEVMVLSREKEQKKKFLLLLRHRPVIEEGTEGHFDLQLSGHTHGGQLFPLPGSRHKIGGHSQGLKKLKNGGYIYVSNGAGFVGAPLRYMAPPEITVFDLENPDWAERSYPKAREKKKPEAEYKKKEKYNQIVQP